VGTFGEGHVVFELEKISIRAKDRASGRIKSLEKTIAIGNSDVGLIGGRKYGRAANVCEGIGEAEVRRDGSRVRGGCASLVIEEFHSEAWIDSGLIRVCGWAIDLVQTESCEECGFV
jgi:hypothetical protein